MSILEGKKKFYITHPHQFIYYILYFYINNIFLFCFYYYFIKIIKYFLSHMSPLLPQTLHLSLFPNPWIHPSKPLPLSYPQPTSWILCISNPSSFSFLDPLSLSPLSLLNFLSSKTHTLTDFLWACSHSVTDLYMWQWWWGYSIFAGNTIDNEIVWGFCIWRDRFE